jgi:UDP-GlcNAc:undecaprenyl-phosphate GlcNAc-1-phosphate transferase
MHLFFSLIIFLLSLLFLKIYQRLSIKFNIIDIPNSLSIHSKETPTGAGIVFALIFFLSIFLNQIYFDDFIKFDNPKNYLVLLVAITSLVLISFYDDLKNIHPLIRLFSQLSIIFLCTSLFDLTNINLPIKLLIFLIIYFWVYTINIVNFTDGIDGFLAVNALTFFLGAFIYCQNAINENFIYFISLTILPILFAYFFFNKPKATLFMGDTGSIFLGFLIGYVSIKIMLNDRLDIIVSLLAYTYLDCTLTLIKKILKKQYPWARLFDYFFLIPIKNNISAKKILTVNVMYNLLILIIVFFQIFYNQKILCLLSLLLASLLIYYFSSFANSSKS